MSATTETHGPAGPVRLRQDGRLLDRRPRRRARGSPTSSTPPTTGAPVDERDVDDLRFAFSVLTTYWYRVAPDAPAARHRPAGVPPRVRRRALQHRRASRGVSREALERGAADAARRLVPGGLRRRRPPRAGASRSRPSRSATPTTTSHRLELAKLGELTAESAPLEEQVWHTYAPVEMPSAEGVDRGAHAARDLAGLRERARPLHAAAARRAAGQTFEIEVAADTRTALPGVHARLRDDHVAGDARTTRGAARLVRRARGRPGPLRQGRAAGAARGRRAARRLRPHDPPRALHGLRPQPPGALHARGQDVGPGRRHLGPDAVAPRQGLPAPRASDAQHAFWGQRRRRAEHAAPARASTIADEPTRSSSAPARTGSPPRSGSPRPAARCSCSRPPTRPAARCAPRS